MSQHAELTRALAHCQSANAEPGDADLGLWHAVDTKIAALIDRLITDHDEGGPEARAILHRISSGRMPGLT